MHAFIPELEFRISTDATRKSSRSNSVATTHGRRAHRGNSKFGMPEFHWTIDLSISIPPWELRYRRVSSHILFSLKKPSTQAMMVHRTPRRRPQPGITGCLVAAAAPLPPYWDFLSRLAKEFYHPIIVFIYICVYVCLCKYQHSSTRVPHNQLNIYFNVF